MVAATVPLPTAVGPASTTRRAGAGVPVTVGSLTASAPRAELGLEGRDLLDAEAANTAALSDAQPLHQLAGPDLAQAGPRLQKSEERRVGKEWVRKDRARGWPEH